MTYWGPAENQQLHGSFAAYGAVYAPYLHAMAYYNNGPDDPSSNPLSTTYYNNYEGDAAAYSGTRQGPGQAQDAAANMYNIGVFNGDDLNRNSSSGGGAVRKQNSDRNKKQWNGGAGGGRKNEQRYGSGRTFSNRTARPDYGNWHKDERQRAVQETADVLRSFSNPGAGGGGGEKENLTGSTYNQSNPTPKGNNDGGRYPSSKYRDSYDDNRRGNFKSRDYSDSRSYGRYNKPNNSRYYESNGQGNGEGREGYVAREKNSWRRSGKCNEAKQSKKKLDAASQRERLEQMLLQRILECLVCCEKVKHTDKIWTCQQCYLILHLKCTIAWADSSKLDNGWRCPACQNVCSLVPKQYFCYCGKVQGPRPIPGVVPHACGESCLKKGRTCEHKCPMLCHPGPCPDCNIMVAKSCGCGATKQTTKCSSDTEIVCDAVCDKPLDCGSHKCQSQCHPGACTPCAESLRQICHCGKEGRRVPCTSEHRGSLQYACGEPCDKLLACGNHRCQRSCHEGDCDGCSRSVEAVRSCPCGKSQLELVRTSCLDEIPCCDKICGKRLKCGQPSSPHTCERPCHEGDCPPCFQTTLVRCRCGHMDKELPCQELTTKADDARCEKKCTKKRLCGKHRCNQRCCIELEHFCPLPCNHALNCGQHRCERTCHSGRCPQCIETSFEELYCECGASVLYPPVPCGTKPPACNNSCSRPRPCGHDVNHTCHTGACPPCTVLCKRWCYGKHEQRSAIPCYQEDFSCGRPCNKQMPCGTHLCIKRCHQGACPLPCKQKCTIKRAQCGHPCGAPCHRAYCPSTVCKFSVPITCQCGLQKGTRRCVDLADEYKEMEMACLKDKMSDLLKDQPVDITDIVNKPKKMSVLKILECTEECKVLERNTRLAIGLQIRNPDLSQKLTPRYSDFMRGWTKKDSNFCQKIHDKLSELVQLAKQSKQKSRSLSFESMNRDKRHFVHEYCEHFGCESAAYDQEPNRNIVATAFKDKSWLPSMSLMEVIQRENGQRKVPGPMLSSSGAVGKSETVSLKLPGRMTKTSTPPEDLVEVDYFDNPPA